MDDEYKLYVKQMKSVLSGFAIYLLGAATTALVAWCVIFDNTTISEGVATVFFLGFIVILFFMVILMPYDTEEAEK